MPCWLSLKWLYDKLRFRGHDVQLQIARTIKPSMLNKQYKKHHKSGHKWLTKHRVLKSSESKMGVLYISQEMKFSMKDFSSKFDQIRRKLKSLILNTSFCAVIIYNHETMHSPSYYHNAFE